MTKFYPGWAEREPIASEPPPAPRTIRRKLKVDTNERVVTAQPRDNSSPIWCQRGAEWYLGGSRTKKTTAT